MAVCLLLGVDPCRVAGIVVAQAPPPAGIAQDSDRAERLAIERLKVTPAAGIEKDLPPIAFGMWLEQVLGGPLTWELNDCGEGPREREPVPWCIQIDAPRGATLSMSVGDSTHGMGGRPQLFWGTIRLFDIDRAVRRLADLPALVKQSDERRARFHDHPLRELAAEEATRIGRAVPVDRLDEHLPHEAFENWFAALMPSGSKIEWRLQPCGGWNTQPQCVWVQADWPDGSRALIALDLETVQRGLGDTPSLATASVYDRRRPHIDRFASLSDFAAAIRALRQAPRD